MRSVSPKQGLKSRLPKKPIKRLKKYQVPRNKLFLRSVSRKKKK